jgi:hypothetical protein
MNSDTPETNAAEIGHAHKVVPSDFARKLERELGAAHWLIRQIYNDLPTKRDWLNPEYEKAMKVLLDNVKEHAPLSAGASVDHGVDVETTQEHENRAADRGCCVSSCSESSFVEVPITSGMTCHDRIRMLASQGKPSSAAASVFHVQD